MNNEQLVSRFLQEDKRAIEQMDTWIQQAARPYRHRLAHGWEDVLQEIRIELLQLFRKGEFEGRSSPKTYIWRVVNHTCIDYLRKHTRWTFTTLDTLSENESPTAPPEAGQQRADTRMSLLRILEKVPGECRDLWQMILAGYHYRQMSRKLHISEGALRVKVHRCRQKATALRLQPEA